MLKMKLGTKLQSAFLIISFIGTLVAGIGLHNMSKINDQADHMYNEELMGLTHIKDANINLIYIGRARGNLLLSTDQVERDKNLANIKKYQTRLQENIAQARKLFLDEKSKDIFAEYENINKQYDQDLQDIILLVKDAPMYEESAQLKEKMNETRAVANRMDEMLLSLAHIKEEKAHAEAIASVKLYQESKYEIIALVFISLMGGVIIGVLMTRKITSQLGGEPEYAVQIANRVASGDLTHDIITKDKDTSSLLFAMKTMQNSLVEIVSQVRTGTDIIATASKQIASGSMDLSSRTEEQASSLEETASSMEEITSTVMQNNSNAKVAQNMVQDTVVVASNGSSKMDSVMKSITNIEQQSNEMTNIISVIEGIAFQTNILALNAAVEAARAGEQGRGFAVVASEVRNLAQRSSIAAKEIKALINDSVQAVASGNEQAKVAQAVMQDVVQRIEKVSTVIHDITSASSEQTNSIEQINEAIMQMDDVTQQNAALVEEAAAASASLQEQAVHLSKLASVFKVDKQYINQPNIQPKFEEKKTVAQFVDVKPLQKKMASKPAALSSNDWEEF